MRIASLFKSNFSSGSILRLSAQLETILGNLRVFSQVYQGNLSPRKVERREGIIRSFIGNAKSLDASVRS